MAAILDIDTSHGIEAVNINDDAKTVAVGWVDSSMFADFETTSFSELLDRHQKVEDTLAKARLSDNKTLNPFDPWNVPLEKLSRYADAFPNNPKLIYRYASQLYKTGRKQDAVRTLKQTMEAAPDNEQLTDLYMGMLVTEGQLELAVDFATQAKIAHPESKVLLFNTACAYARLGDAEEAVHHLGLVIQLDWPELLYLLNDPDLDGVRSEPRFKNLQDTLTFRLISTIFAAPAKPPSI